MSMNFDKPIDDESKDFIKKMFGDDIEAMDSKTVLLKCRSFTQQQMKEVANKTKQVATLELNNAGEIKTLSDGTRYQVTASGWVKL